MKMFDGILHSNNWKGGEFYRNGYVFVYSLNHPFKNYQGYIKRSRLVMENKIGRYLNKAEQVHHLNLIKDDDRVENLKLFSSNKEHILYHYSQGMNAPMAWLGKKRSEETKKRMSLGQSKRWKIKKEEYLKKCCKNGHLYNEENTYKRPDGNRDCRICGVLRRLKFKEKKEASND